MRKIEITEATRSLGQYALDLKGEPLVLTEGGHANAALLPIDDADAESMALSLSPRFQALIEQAREEHRSGSSFSADEVRRDLVLEARSGIE